MRKKGNVVFAILIVTAGVVLFNYPTIATFVNNLTANREIYEYDQTAETMDDEELNEIIELAQAYNQSLPMSFPADPFTGTNIHTFEGTDFENFAMVQPGAMIGYIEIPDIHIYQPVYYGTTDDVLDKGLGLVENTSLPVGGPGTHAVISGHTGMATRKLFTDLVEMKEGAKFFVHVLNQDFAYEVDQIRVVLPEETEELAIRQDEDLITLVTCTPFGINDHRLLVRGRRIAYDFSQDAAPVPFATDHPTWLRWIAILGAGLLFLLLVIWRIRKDQKKRAAQAG